MRSETVLFTHRRARTKHVCVLVTCSIITYIQILDIFVCWFLCGLHTNDRAAPWVRLSPKHGAGHAALRHTRVMQLREQILLEA